jgi:hypothetical protein
MARRFEREQEHQPLLVGLRAIDLGQQTIRQVAHRGVLLAEQLAEIGMAAVDGEQVGQEPAVVTRILGHVLARDPGQLRRGEPARINLQQVLEGHDPERQLGREGHDLPQRRPALQALEERMRGEFGLLAFDVLFEAFHRFMLMRDGSAGILARWRTGGFRVRRSVNDLYISERHQKNWRVSKMCCTLSPLRCCKISSDAKQYLGVVVQLVRIPACHAGGRGFESRPLRQNSKCPRKRAFFHSAEWSKAPAGLAAGLEAISLQGNRRPAERRRVPSTY